MVGNVSCALLGCYLILRRLSLLGDAISHGVLPGIVLAYLLTGYVAGWAILVGAMAFGLLTAFLTQTLTSFGNVPEDASMGVVFTGLFAVGVVLLTNYAGQVDLDQKCVFVGMIESVPLRTFPLWRWDIPTVLPTMLATLGLTLAFILLFWKELKIASFDPALARTQGINPTLVHYLLMALVAAVVVASFRVVGSILVIAMLIVPGACGHLLSDRLTGMMLWAALVATLSSILGYFLASPAVLASNVSGMMAVAAGLQFLLVILFAPRHGILAKAVRNLRLAVQIVAEDILASLYRREEAGTAATPLADRPGWLGRLAQWSLRRGGHIRHDAEGATQLTDSGREKARSLVRSHRLWEAFLGRNFDLPLDHLHDPAERMEHFIGPELQKELAAELQEPGADPHGREIPR